MSNTVDVGFDVQLSQLFAREDGCLTTVDCNTAAIQELVDTINPNGTSKVFLEYVHDDSLKIDPGTYGLTLSLRDHDSRSGFPEWIMQRFPPESLAYDAYVCVRIGGGVSGALLDKGTAKKLKNHTIANGISSALGKKSVANKLNVRAPDRHIDQSTAHELQHAIEIANDTLGKNRMLGIVDDALESIEDHAIIASLFVAGLGSEITRRKLELNNKKTVTGFVLAAILSCAAAPEAINIMRYATYRSEPGERRAFKTGRRWASLGILSFSSND